MSRDVETAIARWVVPGAVFAVMGATIVAIIYYTFKNLGDTVEEVGEAAAAAPAAAAAATVDAATDAAGDAVSWYTDTAASVWSGAREVLWDTPVDYWFGDD